MWSEIRDGLEAYETAKHFSGTVLLEELVVGVIFGFWLHSLTAGVIAFFVCIFLWFVPVVGAILMIAFSAFYAVLAYWITSFFHIPTPLCVGIAVLVFLGMFGAHFLTLGHE